MRTMALAAVALMPSLRCLTNVAAMSLDSDLQPQLLRPMAMETQTQALNPHPAPLNPFYCYVASYCTQHKTGNAVEQITKVPRCAQP